MSITFTEQEIELLGQTADSLGAFVGRHVLAQLDTVPEGYEWVAFACPLDTTKDNTDVTQIQMGGPTARLIGSEGGLGDIQEEMYLCQFLYAIQLTDAPDARFVRINDRGEPVFWSNDLNELLPFTLEKQSSGCCSGGSGGCGCSSSHKPEEPHQHEESGCGCGGH